MELRHLRYFDTLAETLNFTRAAERLQRVQSNVTTRVRQLEADLGTPLFLREGKRMALTPEGEVLRGYADRLLALAEEALRVAQRVHPEVVYELVFLQAEPLVAGDWRLPGEPWAGHLEGLDKLFLLADAPPAQAARPARRTRSSQNT